MDEALSLGDIVDIEDAGHDAGSGQLRHRLDATSGGTNDMPARMKSDGQGLADARTTTSDQNDALACLHDDPPCPPSAGSDAWLTQKMLTVQPNLQLKRTGFREGRFMATRTWCRQ